MKFLTYFAGVVTGVYLAQNYQIPDVKSIVIQIQDEMKRREKK